jgi:hypothetical protein
MDSVNLERLIIKTALEDKPFLVTISSVFQDNYFEDLTIRSVFTLLKGHVQKYDNIMPRSGVISEIGTDEVKNLFKEIDALDFNVTKNYEWVFDETNKYLKERAIKCAILDSVELIEKKEAYAQISSLIEDALIRDLRIDLGINYFDTLNERIRRILENSTIRVPTYYPEFDEYINGGFPPYTLSVFVSRIHGWKSATLANFTARQVMHGHNVLLLTMEMAEDAFAQRFDAIFTKLDINKMYNVKTETLKMIQGLKAVKETPGRGQLWIKQFPTGEATVLDFKRYVRELKMRGVIPSIILVDYINLMKSAEDVGTELYSKVKKISEELRALSFVFDCPVITVSQLNRPGSVVAFDELDFVYICESMGLPATADFMMIYGEDEDKMVYESELNYIIIKNRLGGRVREQNKFYYDSRSLKMYDQSELDLWMEEAKISGDDRKLAEQKEEKRVPGRSKR